MQNTHHLNGKYFATYHFEEQYTVGPCDSVEDCREEAEREFPEHPKILIGKLVQWRPSLDIDSAMEWEADHAYSECGECAEDYLD